MTYKITDLISSVMTRDGTPLNVDFENIKHRFDDKFVADVIEVFSEVRKANTDKMANELLGGITTLVKGFMNIDVRLEVIEGANAMVPYESMSVYANSPLQAMEYYWSSEATGHRIKRKGGKVDISVNTSTGEITGVEGIPHWIHLGTELMRGDEFSVDEVAAVFFHELGHIYTYYLTLPNVSITNFLLSDFVESLLTIDSPKKRMVLVDEAEKKFNMEVLEKDRLVRSEERKEISLIVYTSDVGRMKSQLGSNPYDSRNAEAMADQFVTRLGMSLPLVTALVKGAGEMEMLGRYSWSRKIGVVIASAFQMHPAAMLLSFLFIGFLTDDILGGTYDQSIRRIKVLRHGLVDRYKQSKGEVVKAAIIAEIEVLDTFMGGYDEGWSDFNTIIVKHVLPWGRARNNSIKWQKALEDMANSNLTIAAGKLSNII